VIYIVELVALEAPGHLENLLRKGLKSRSLIDTVGNPLVFDCKWRVYSNLGALILPLGRGIGQHWSPSHSHFKVLNFCEKVHEDQG
jgi:hypothetical protein